MKTVHFANGERREIPIVYGQDLSDWVAAGADSTPPARATVAWTGSNPFSYQSKQSIRLFHSRWDNPLPDCPVLSLDFVSAMKAAAPFVVAVTAER